MAASAGWSNAGGSSVYVGTYASSIAGSGEINTPQRGTQSRIDFGTIALNSSHTLALQIQNLATDPGSASDLTIEVLQSPVPILVRSMSVPTLPAR